MIQACPDCGNPEMVLEGGCPFCFKCGWSKCA